MINESVRGLNKTPGFGELLVNGLADPFIETHQDRETDLLNIQPNTAMSIKFRSVSELRRVCHARFLCPRVLMKEFVRSIHDKVRELELLRGEDGIQLPADIDKRR
jgi:hypothetical protein